MRCCKCGQLASGHSSLSAVAFKVISRPILLSLTSSGLFLFVLHFTLCFGFQHSYYVKTITSVLCIQSLCVTILSDELLMLLFNYNNSKRWLDMMGSHYCLHSLRRVWYCNRRYIVEAMYSHLYWLSVIFQHKAFLTTRFKHY